MPPKAASSRVEGSGIAVGLPPKLAPCANAALAPPEPATKVLLSAAVKPEP